MSRRWLGLPFTVLAVVGRPLQIFGFKISSTSNSINIVRRVQNLSCKVFFFTIFFVRSRMLYKLQLQISYNTTKLNFEKHDMYQELDNFDYWYKLNIDMESNLDQKLHLTWLQTSKFIISGVNSRHFPDEGNSLSFSCQFLVVQKWAEILGHHDSSSVRNYLASI